MLKNLLSSYKQTITDRGESSLLFIFILLWLIINWKAMMVLALGDAQIESKIAGVESLITFQTMVIYPLIGTVLYLGVYPLVAYQIYKYHLYIDKRKQLVKLKHECDVMEAEMKRAKLKARLNDSKYNSEVRIKRDKLDHLYLMAERKYALKMRRLEYEAKSREVRKHEKRHQRLQKVGVSSSA